MSQKLKLGLTLFALGFLGALTLLTVSFPIPEEFQQMQPSVFKLFTLVNPTVFLLISVVVGIALFEKVNLTVPVISSLLEKDCQNANTVFAEQLKFGVSLGFLAGAVVVLMSSIPALSEQFNAYYSNLEVTLLARFGYGGITEELLLRFGLMTLFVWLISKLTKRLNDTTYWVAIILSTALFALGHFPAVFAAVPNPTTLFLVFVLVGNSIISLSCGWLYWKKGLEAAIIAHAFAHVAMVSIGLLL